MNIERATGNCSSLVFIFFSFIYELTSLYDIIIYRANFVFYIVFVSMLDIYIYLFSMLLESKLYIVKNIDMNID